MFFFKVTQILSVTSEEEPIARPRWLIIYCLHKECLEIFNHMQSQPNSDLDWERLRWANRTIDLLPALDNEISWPENAPIPPAFTMVEANRETAVSIIYDMVAKFFFNIQLLEYYFSKVKKLS